MANQTPPRHGHASTPGIALRPFETKPNGDSALPKGGGQKKSKLPVWQRPYKIAANRLV